jgi:hypothetical protein
MIKPRNASKPYLPFQSLPKTVSQGEVIFPPVQLWSYQNKSSSSSSLTLDAVATATRNTVFQLKNLIWQVANGSNGCSHKVNKAKGKSLLGNKGLTHGLLLKIPFIKLDKSVSEQIFSVSPMNGSYSSSVTSYSISFTIPFLMKINEKISQLFYRGLKWRDTLPITPTSANCKSCLLHPLCWCSPCLFDVFLSVWRGPYLARHGLKIFHATRFSDSCFAWIMSHLLYVTCLRRDLVLLEYPPGTPVKLDTKTLWESGEQSTPVHMVTSEPSAVRVG